MFRCRFGSSGSRWWWGRVWCGGRSSRRGVGRRVGRCGGCRLPWLVVGVGWVLEVFVEDSVGWGDSLVVGVGGPGAFGFLVVGGLAELGE